MALRSVLAFGAKTGGKGGVLDGELAPEIYEAIELAEIPQFDD